jgi:cytochrome P450
LDLNRLFFVDNDAIRPIYATSSKCIKGDQYTTSSGTPNVLSVMDRSSHSVERKRLSSAFAPVHFLDWEYEVAGKVLELLDQIDRHVEVGRVMDFRYWSSLFTLDAIMSISVSYDAGFLKSPSDLVHTNTEVLVPISMMDGLRAVNRTLKPIWWNAAAFPLLKRLSKILMSYRKQWKLSAQ